jgi:hypothetical protein
MRKNRLLTIMLVITGSVALVFSGCQKQSQITQESGAIGTVRESIPEVEPILAGPPAAIEFEETIADFGQVGPRTISSKELKFRNTGEGVLKIEQISQCCGVFAKADKEEYSAGETGIVTIELHASGNIGLFERNPIVYNNDPNNKTVMLTVKAEIVQKVVWEPESFKLFRNVENGGCPKLTIKSVDGQEFAITGIRSTGDCITADYNPTIKKTEHVLDLKVNMEKLTDQMYGELNISMNHPQGDLATIFFDVVPKYSLSPKQLVVFRMKENVPQTQTIKIIDNYKQEDEIEDTSSRDNTIKLIDYKKTEEGYELNIEVTPPPTPQGEQRFSDIFYINLKSGEQLALTFHGYYGS